MRILIAAMLLSTPGAVHGKPCAQLGSWTYGSTVKPLGELWAHGADSGELITSKGHLIVRRSAGGRETALCGSAQAPIDLSACLGLSFDWDALGGDSRRAEEILERWSGARVRLQGRFAGASRRGDPGRTFGELEAVSFVQVMTLEPSEEFCLEGSAQGPPAEPGRPGDEASPHLREGRYFAWSRCAHVIYQPRGLWCVDREDPVLWMALENGAFRTAPFTLPAGYSSRDLTAVKPLSDTSLALVVDDRLFSWRDGVVDALDGPVVDMLRQAPRGAYYRVRTLTPDGAVSWNALRRVHEDLGIETLWQSSAQLIEDYESPRPPEPGKELTLWVRDGDEQVTLRFDPVSASWGVPDGRE